LLPDMYELTFLPDEAHYYITVGDVGNESDTREMPPLTRLLLIL